jgi:ComEC/Rec2-related protein
MQYKILCCLAGLVAGIFAGCGIPERHLPGYALPVLLAVLPALLWKKDWLPFSRYELFTLATGFVLFFSAGSISVLSTRCEPDMSSPGGTVIRAKVISYREMTEKLGQVVVAVTLERSETVWEKRRGRMLLLVRPDSKIVYCRGDLWQFGPMVVSPVSFKPTGNGFIPGRYWLSRGIRHEARLSPGRATLVRESSQFSPAGFFGHWQSALAGRISRIPMSEASRSLVKAMILGDRSDLSTDTMTSFSRAGIIHVLSVSGLHVGIIYFIIAWLLKKPGLLGARIRSFLCLSVVWLYAGITGFSPSALRSAGMITLFELARTGRRGTPGLQVLAGTALIHCLINPYTVFSAGAQLSYLAVAGIFIWNPVFNPIISGMKSIPRYFAGAIGISLSAQSLITPVLLFWFGWLPLYFLIGNVFLLPFMIFGFYLGLVITILDFAGISIPLLCRGMDLLIGGAMKGAEWLGNLPGNLYEPKGLNWCDVVLYFLVLFTILSYCDKPQPRKIQGLLAGTGLILLSKLVV